MQRIGKLINAFFGEFGTAVRSYAFAKHSEDMTPEIEAFMQNPSPDTDAAELHKLGWPSVAQLVSELSMPVLHMQQARRQNGEDVNSPEITSESARKIRDQRILPVLQRYTEAHGLFELGDTDAERAKNLLEQVPGYALVVEALMHDADKRGLYYALMQKAKGEKLSDKDNAVLAANTDIVETVDSMMAAAGNGYATKPCNQIYRAAHFASGKWSEFVQAEQAGLLQELDGSAFTARTHYETAMKAHKECLDAYREVHKTLGPVRDMIDGLIDTTGKAELSAEFLDTAAVAVRALPQAGATDKIRFNEKRIQTALEAVQKNSRPEYEKACEFEARNTTTSKYAATTQQDVSQLLEQIDVLKKAFAETPVIPIRDERFRDVYMGTRALYDRIEMMQINAEQLYVDMGRITGKQNAEWLARETPGEQENFTPPAKPSDRLKRLAEEIQRNCLAQHESATKCRGDLQAVIETMGKNVDRFDVIHDFFDRMHTMVGEQVKSMEARQALWDNVHGGVGATKGV